MDGLFTKVAVGIVVTRDKKILMGKRLVEVGNGKWGLPGGHLEYGENIEAAAKRELLEETGLKADLKLVNITNDPKTEGLYQHYIHFVYEASNIQGEPVNTEPDKCAGWEWFSLDDLPEDIFFGHQKLLNGYLKHEFFSD
jgi:8-oxo-dGTP diphosphatase